jgi:NADH:ubiquinone oxidoreductase subunit F (NADH-binding)/(2Fe-2S) ferredoxin/NAD-dependent dihydropyrimidine dehydrogenase PreA subunit
MPKGKKIKNVKDLTELRKRIRLRDKSFTSKIFICGGTGCRASHAQDVIDALRKALKKREIEKSVQIRVTGCHGFCEQGPLMIIEPGNIFYCGLKPKDADEIITTTIVKGEVIERLLYIDPVTSKKVRTESEIPFYRAQDRQLLAQNTHLDPCSIEDYIATRGYSALTKILTEFTPEDVINEIRTSGLRGRGGAGFPTAKKWAECWSAPGEEKYVICNADEGDPGAYMDRSVLEGNPHLVIEGMMIGAWAIGAEQGYIYVRNEYPLAVKHVQIALQQAREYGLLGNNILGRGFSFDIKIGRGGGAFVCGESTALMASLEGKAGEPRAKDVHTTTDGLWHKPTTLNNVETWANVPSIISNGGAWFASKGTTGSKGTKIFALTGQVKNTGLVEVAMGTSLQTIVFDIGGGAINGRAIKAVQTGGPSGGCLPVDKFDLPVDFDALYNAGSMVGSGGIVVMDEKTCMVDVAKYFLAFLLDESCGKCVPCRLGIDRMLEIVTDITEGRGQPEHIGLLKELADTVSSASLCGLGKTAPNPVLSTLRYFPEEYEAHIHEKRCPAGMCQALIKYEIDTEICNGCGACLRACPYDAIEGKKKEAHVIDQLACQKCGICLSVCKFDSITVT